MRRELLCSVCMMMLLLSCGTSKKSQLSPAVESRRTVEINLEGESVMQETVKMTGIEMSESLSSDGMSIVQRPYKWFAGIGKADNKQVAIEMAQREAYATISRVLNNAINDTSSRGTVVVNNHVQQALTSHWHQVSTSMEKACEPYGNTSIEYSPSTGMYTVTAKVGVRGDRFNQMLNAAGDYKPSDLTGEDLDLFIETNRAIMEAARGN